MNQLLKDSILNTAKQYIDKRSFCLIYISTDNKTTLKFTNSNTNDEFIQLGKKTYNLKYTIDMTKDILTQINNL